MEHKFSSVVLRNRRSVTCVEITPKISRFHCYHHLSCEIGQIPTKVTQQIWTKLTSNHSLLKYKLFSVKTFADYPLTWEFLSNRRQTKMLTDQLWLKTTYCITCYKHWILHLIHLLTFYFLVTSVNDIHCFFTSVKQYHSYTYFIIFCFIFYSSRATFLT